jgi:hypothetical protein
MPSGHLEQFKDLIPNIYDAYANKNFDVLVSYYSAFFKFGSKNPYHI